MKNIITRLCVGPLIRIFIRNPGLMETSWFLAIMRMAGVYDHHVIAKRSDFYAQPLKKACILLQLNRNKSSTCVREQVLLH